MTLDNRFRFPALLPLTAAANLFNGTPADDSIDGLSGNDTLRGEAGADALMGGEGDDLVQGGAGDDLLAGGAGNDTLDGGDGFDLVSYAESETGVWISLSRRSAQAENDQGRDLLNWIEGVIGSTANDQLRGDVGANLLVGSDGNDLLEGGNGDDTLWGGEGNDTIAGGSGTDTATYGDISTALTIDLGISNAQETGAGLDILSGIEVLIGGAGNDRLTGGRGNERLEGGAGNDSLDGAAGVNTLMGGLGDDVYRVRTSDEVVFELPDQGRDTILSSTSLTLISEVENLELLGIRSLQGTGNTLDNTITGNGSANVLSGLEGNDSLYGGGGMDKLYGGDGADLLVSGGGSDLVVGGGGADTASFAGETAGIRVDLSAANVVVATASGNDTLRGIEHLIGGGGGDTLTGDADGNSLDGGTGADNLAGRGGADSLYGGAGNDTLTGGAGDDSLAGGADFDVAVFAAGYVEGCVRWNATADSFTVTTSEGTDQVTEVERFSFAGTLFGADEFRATRLTDGADSLAGTADNDRVLSFAGNDTIGGLAGDDSIDSGAGDDSLSGGTGNDSLLGGAGHDTLDAGGGNDLLYGGDGDDRLIAGAGDSTVMGGAGTDTVVFNFAFAQASFAYGGGLFTVMGPNGMTRVGEVENFSFSDAPSVNRRPLLTVPDKTALRVDEGTDIAPTEVVVHLTLETAATATESLSWNVAAGSTGLTAGDFATAGGVALTVLPSGTVTFEIGETSATITLWVLPDNMPEAEESFSLNLNAATPRLLLTQNRITVVIANDDATLLGPGADLFTGTAVNDRTNGGAGEDTLQGMAGNDNLLGGDGDDSIDGGDGDDTVVGGTGDDTLIGGTGSDTLTYALTAGNVTVNLSRSAAQSTGVDGRDRINGFETLIGGLGNDSLTGSRAANRIEGGQGADTLDGNGADDTLVGGNGDDVLIVDSVSDLVIEAANGGKDRVLSEISWVLGDNLEELELTGAKLIDGTGNALDNLMIGSRRDNLLTGGAGNDTLQGEDGRDKLAGDADDDLLYGGKGDDTLDGGAGKDTLDGGEGDDTYLINDANDVILESLGAGRDEARTTLQTLTLAANVDDLVYLGDGVLTGTGNGLANTMGGGEGDDTLYGGAGNDSLRGYVGNDSLDGGTEADLLYGGDGGDRLYGGAGNDALLGDTGDDSIAGGTGDDRLFGGTGNDTLIADGGTDTLIGGSGSDSFILSVSGAVAGIADLATGDTVQVAAGAIAAAVEIAAFVATSATVNDGTFAISTRAGGGTIDMTLATGASGFTLTGLAGNDTLTGSAASDNLVGGSGNDVLVATGGSDSLTGGAGGDTFVFASSGHHHVITGYSALENDTIDLSALGLTATALGAAETVTAQKLYQLTGDLSDASDAAVVADALNNSGTIWTSANATAWVLVQDNTGSSLFRWDEVFASDGASESELTMVVRIENVAMSDLWLQLI